MGDKEENSELLIDEKTLPADVEFDLRQEMHAQQLHDDDAASTSSAQGRHGALRPAGSTDCLLNTSAGGSEDATPVARRTMNRTAHASMPDLSFAGRRQQYTSGGRTTPVKPMSMREYDQTLTHLRKENWNLKLKLFLLEGKIPKLVNLTGEDVVKLNVELSVEVESLRKERAAEEERFTQMSNDITLLRRNAEREVDSLSNEIQLLRKQNDAQIDESRQLQHKLFAAQKQVIDLEAELRYARENFNGSDSEGNSNVSLLSERDRRILQLESAVVDKDYVAIELKHDYEDRLQRLQELLDKRQNISLTDSGDKTPRKDEMMSEQTLVDCGSLIVAPDISEQIRDLEERLASKDALISSLQMDLDARNNAAVTDVQPLENRVAELQASLAVAQDDIKKRDRTIQGLVKHVKKHSSVDAVEVSANVKEKKQLETEVAAAAEVRDALLSELGDHSAEEMSVLDARRIHADIDRLRTDLDRLTGENGVLQQQLQALDAAADPATEANLSQLSEFAKQSDNLNRIMRDRLSTLIAKVGDESLFNHLRALNDTSRHATQSAFDTPPSTAPLRVATAAHFEQSTTTPGGRRVSFAVDLIDMTSATDLYNRSVNTTQDLHNLKDKLYLLRTICERLFGKLKGSAEFLKDLLEQLGGSELAKKFADGFDSLHFDLDASMRQAQSLLDEVKTAEKSIADLTAQLDQVVNQSMTARSAGQSILTGQEFGLDDSQLHRDSGVTSGTPGTDRHAGGHAEVDRLQQQLQNEREVARSQHSERDALKAALDSELKAKEALESRLASASSENEHLRRELDQADARIAETYDAMKEKDIEMQNVHATLKELDKKLVTMREQHAIEMNERIGRVNELQSRLQQLSQQATTVDELAARLKAADDKLVDASAQSQSLSAMLDQQRQRCLDIQTDAERARAQAKHQSQRAQQLTAEVERLTKAIVESQTLSAAAKKEFDVTRRQLVEAQQSAKEAFDQADALSTRVDRLEQHLATTKQRLSDAQKRPTTRDSDSMTVTTGADLEDLAARCEKYRQYARAVRSKVSAIEEDVRRRQSSENAADGSPHQRSLSPTRLSLGGLDRLTETVIKERQNSADLSAIIRQLQANNKELNRRLLENNDVIRTANERIAEKQQQCTQLSDALRRTEQRIVEERTKRLSIPISPSNSWSSLDAAQKSSLPEADMATPSDVSPKGSRHGASSDRLKQEMQEGVRRARRLLKYVKAMSDSAATIKTEDWKRLDDEVRALRYALDHCVHLMSTSSKENVAPGAGHDQQQFEVDRLKVENERLREYLLSSQQMLQEAQGRLQSQPMGIPSDINDGIVRELSKMRQVMQKTRQDVTTMQSRRGGGRPRT